MTNHPQQTKTKEEILDKHYATGMHWKIVNRGNVLNAMEDYAIITQISFVDWLILNEWKSVSHNGKSAWTNKSVLVHGSDAHYAELVKNGKTTAQLQKIFEKEITK